MIFKQLINQLKITTNMNNTTHNLNGGQGSTIITGLPGL